MKFTSTTLNGAGGSLSPSLPSLPYVELLPFRAYPRLTAPNRGKTRLNALNRAKIFSGGSRACNRGCATETGFAFIRVHSWLKSDIGKSSQLKLNKGKYNQLKPSQHREPIVAKCRQLEVSVGNCSLPRNWPDQTLTPSSYVVPPLGGLSLRVPLRPHVRKSLTLTPWSQPTAKVAYCRCSKIRPVFSPFNLNARNPPSTFGPNRKSYIADRKSRNFNTSPFQVGRTILGEPNLNTAPLPTAVLGPPISDPSPLSFP